MPTPTVVAPNGTTSTQQANGSYTLAAPTAKPVDNTVVAPTPSSTPPLMVTSNQSRAQYGQNVQTMQNATGTGMPSATAAGKSTAAQLGNTVGAASTPPTGTTININGTDSSSTPSTPNTTSSTTNNSTGSTTPTDTTTDTSTASGMGLLDPTTKQLLQNNIDDLTQQSQAAQAQVDSATATANNDPAMLAAANSIKAQYDQLIQAMTDKNNIMLGMSQTSVAAFGGLGQMNQNFMSSEMSQAAQRIGDLQAQEADLIMKSNQAYQSGDVKALNDAMANYNTVNSQKMAAVSALLKAASDAKTQAQTDANNLRDYNLKVTEDNQAEQDKVTTAISGVQSDAAKAGAPQSVLAAIAAAPDQTSAITAAGAYLQTSTNPAVSQYLFYQNQAKAAGQEPVSFDDYQKQQAQLADSQAYSKAYETAAGSAAGAASAVPVSDPSTPGTGLGGTSGGGSILSAAGMSIGAFNYLTQGTASMSRMPVAQRNQIMTEAQNWLNNNGIDISTFQSQYKAYNDVLQKNIERANQTKIMAGEVSGSADALLSVLKPTTEIGHTGSLPQYDSKQTLGNLSSVNILDIIAGKQVNSAFAQKYSFQIQAMANDLAGYFAAARGAPSPEDSDKLDAANVISSGMNSTSVQAFKESIQANEEKVAGVVNTAVTSSQKQVWTLFGIGDNYSSPVNTNDLLLQQNQNDPGNIGDHLNSQTTDPSNPAGLSL